MSLLYQRKKIAGVEIDFIMWCPDGSFGGHIVFVEVKSLRRVEMMAYRISPAQRQRLSVAKSFFESIYSLPVEVLAVYVSPNGEIQDLVLL